MIQHLVRRTILPLQHTLLPHKHSHKMALDKCTRGSIKTIFTCYLKEQLPPLPLFAIPVDGGVGVEVGDDYWGCAIINDAGHHALQTLEDTPSFHFDYSHIL